MGAWQEAWSAAQVALSIASKRFLAGDDGDWIESKRREGEDVRLVALERLARAALELGGSELLSAERAARAVVEAAPYRESGYLLLMRTLAVRGDPAEAVRVYDRARTLLRDELGIPPGPELRALHHELVSTGVEGLESRSAESSLAPLPPLLARPERTPFIGRTAELAALTTSYEMALRAGPRAVTVTGEAGLGKTRLTREFANQVHAGGAVVLYGTAPREAPSPYHPLVEALRHFIRDAPRDAVSGLREVDPPVVARLLPELHERRETALAQLVGDEESGRARTLAALTRLVELASRRGALLALDDMHWADADSLEMIAHLLQNTRAPLLTLIAYRPGDALPAVASALGQASEPAPVEAICLEPLTEHEVETLIRAWAGTGAPAQFARNLRRRSDGNPFFISHLLRHLVRTGAIDPTARRWASAANIWSIGVPHAVRELIELRFTSFGSDGRRVLSAAAVIGNEFTLPLVEATLNDTSESVIEALDAALRGGLIADDPARAGGFRFTHALVREAVYANLSTSRRGRLHRSVAEAIESLHAADLTPWRGDLARHYVAAARAGEDPTPAILNSLAAAANARRSYATEQAEAHYDAALELLLRRPDAELQAEACEGLGDMFALRTMYSQAGEAYIDALVATPARRFIDRARLERKLGYSHLRGHRPDAATQAFDRAEQHLAAAVDSEQAIAEKIEVGLDRTNLLYWQNDQNAMGRVIARIRPLVEAHGNSIHQLRLLDSMVVRDMRRRRFRLTNATVDLAKRALAAAEASGDPTRLSQAVFLVGFSLLWADQPDAALIHLGRALELSTQYRDLMRQTRSLIYMTVAHRRRRAPEEAQRLAARALDAANAGRMVEWQAMAHANLAWVAARQLDFLAARKRAETALHLWSTFSYQQVPFFPGLALWPLVAAALADGDLVSAIEHARPLLEAPVRPVSAPVRRLLESAIAEHEQSASGAEKHLHRALELADGLTVPGRKVASAGGPRRPRSRPVGPALEGASVLQGS